MKIRIKAGNRCSICSCGLSSTLPFCDNAHRNFNQKNGTNYKSIKFIPDDDITFSITSSTWPTNGQND